MRVPFLDLKRAFKEDEPELNSLLSSVAASGQYLFGPKLKHFESDLANHLRLPAEKVVGCHSGTDALILALLAQGVGIGDEVITVGNTAVATAAAIAATGASPVFCDAIRETRLMNEEDCVRRLTPSTKTVILVHLYGNVANVNRLRSALDAAGRGDVKIVEDVAQAQGAYFQQAPAGTIGDYGAFSFFPTKNLGAMGDGGAAIARDQESAEVIRCLRFYGQRERNRTEIARGINSRLDEIQSAVLSFRLARLSARLARKDSIMARYQESFRNLPLSFPELLPGAKPAWHLCVADVGNEKTRDRLQTYLAEQQIETLVHYSIPLNRQNAFRGSTKLPVAEALSLSSISLPFSSFHTDDEIEYVIASVKDFFR